MDEQRPQPIAELTLAADARQRADAAMDAAFIAAVASGDPRDIAVAIDAIKARREPTETYYVKALEAATSTSNTNTLFMIRQYLQEQADMQTKINSLLRELADIHDIQHDQEQRITALEHPQAHEAGA